MKKDAYYFSHDANSQDDPKCMLLIDQLGMEGYGIFWALIERLRQEKEYKLPFAIVPSLARRWATSKEKVEVVIKNFALFIIIDDCFFSERLLRSMTEKSLKASKNAYSKWNISEKSNSETRSQRLSLAREKGTHTKEQWEEMREFFGECMICNDTNDIVKDHIIPIYQGGSDGIDNLQPLCRKCNCSKGADNKDYRINWCLQNACEMPAKWLPTSAIKVKESKVKESKVNNKLIIDNKDIFREFKHLRMTNSENEKLLKLGYSQIDIIKTLESIENYKKNTNYVSMYLTAKKWLENENKGVKEGAVLHNLKQNQRLMDELNNF